MSVIAGRSGGSSAAPRLEVVIRFARSSCRLEIDNIYHNKLEQWTFGEQHIAEPHHRLVRRPPRPRAGASGIGGCSMTGFGADLGFAGAVLKSFSRDEENGGRGRWSAAAPSR